MAGASLSSGSSSYFSLVLRWAGCLDGGLAACHRSTRSSFFAKSDYFDRRLGPRGARVMIDWIERRQRNALARLGRAAARRLRRRAQPAGRRRHRVRPPRHAVLAPVPRLLQRRHGGPGEPALADRAWRALRPHASGEAYQNYIDPTLDGWQRAYYGPNLERCARSRGRWTPTSASASGRRYPGTVMDRDRRGAAGAARLPQLSARRLRASRRDVLGGRGPAGARPHGQPGLAGAAVAAVTLPSLITGPLLGAWLDLTGRADGP